MTPRSNLGMLGMLGTLIAVAASCAPERGDAYMQALAEAARAKGAGRYLEAVSAYDRAADKAQVRRDKAHAKYLAAVTLVASGDAAGAAARLRPIADAKPAAEDSASAAYQLAELSLQRDRAALDRGATDTKPNDREGWSDLERVVLRFPSDGVAVRALRRIVRHDEDTGGPDAALAHLQQLSAKLDGSDLAELVAYEKAMVRNDAGEKRAARDAFLGVAARFPYPKGALWDDALFRASEIDEELGDYAHAIDDLERMVREREVSVIVGSYQRQRFTPALVRIGTLYRDRLHDRPRARAAFQKLYDEFTTSDARDDALWELAALDRDDGDEQASCAHLEQLGKEFPQSRYAPCIGSMCRSAAPSRSTSDAGHAPRCHAYLLAKRVGQPSEHHEDAALAPRTGDEPERAREDDTPK